VEAGVPGERRGGVRKRRDTAGLREEDQGDGAAVGTRVTRYLLKMWDLPLHRAVAKPKASVPRRILAKGGQQDEPGGEDGYAAAARDVLH